MNYDLIIISILRPHSRQILARHFAADPSVSLQKAKSIVENLPAVYMRDLSKGDLEQACAQLEKLGVKYQAVESKNQLDKPVPASISKKESVDTYISEIKQSTDDKTIIKQKQQNKPMRSALSISEKITFTKENSKKREKTISHKKKHLVGTIFSIFLVLVVGIILLIGQKKEFSINKKRTSVRKTVLKTKKNKGQKLKSPKIDSGRDKKKNKFSRGSRGTVSAQEKINSQIFSDSAGSSGSDYDKAIKFYKIAISFNNYNLNAWHGLLATYRSAGMTHDVYETEKKMRELFDENIFTIDNMVQPFGSLVDYTKDNNDVCRIVYNSKSIRRTKLEGEVYLLVKSLVSMEKCLTISLYASTGKGSGMLVRIDSEPFPQTLSQFCTKALITFVE